MEIGEDKMNADATTTGVDFNFLDNATALFKQQLGERVVKTRAGNVVSTIPPLPKFTTTVKIDVVLNGRLDLSILKKEGYDNIKEIYLKDADSKKGTGKGLIEIVNIPETVEILKCTGNRLKSFSFLGGSSRKIKELDFQQNELTDIDFSSMPNLKKINIANNHIQELKDIPAGIKYINCSYNGIRFLDLEGVSELTHLYANNNHIVSILNISPTLKSSLKHVSYYSNPIKDIDALNSIPDLAIYDEEGAVKKGGPTEPVIENDVIEESDEPLPLPSDTTDDSINYKDAINQYFKLKKTYETDMKRKITQIKNRSKDNKRKQRLLLASFKPKCVVCKRPVGSIFKKENNYYTAICGDVGRNPCRLNIRIFNGVSYNFFDDMHYFKEYTENGMEEIIKQKMDVLFNYISEKRATIAFESAFKKYTDYNSGFSILFDRYKEIYENPSKKELIRLKTDRVYEILGEIDERMNEYQKTPTNKELLKDAMELQQRELVPAIIELREAKYQEMTVVCEEEGTGAVGKDDLPKCTLLQHEYKIDNFIYVVDEPKVIRFDT